MSVENIVSTKRIESLIAETFRVQLVQGIKPILSMIDTIEDSQVRLILQARCLDLLAEFEELALRIKC